MPCRYIRAAACPKDVVILLDVSGSMKGLRIEIAKATVEKILDTLTDDDFFNVVMVRKCTAFLLANIRSAKAKPKPVLVSQNFLHSITRSLSHRDPYAMLRDGCLELCYCDMVEWSWWDSSLI